MYLVVKLFTVTDNLKIPVSDLFKRGLYRTMVGDLAFTGLPGKVYTPAEDNGIPDTAFIRDWRTPIEEHHATLRHPVPWGITVTASDTENGIAVGHRGFASDLETAPQILAGVRLDKDKVAAHPKKFGVAGHGTGTGVTILAVAGHDIISGAGYVSPVATAPSFGTATTDVSAPDLVLTPGKGRWFDRGDPARLAVQQKGDVVHREVDKTDQGSFPETTLLRRLAGSPSSKVKYRGATCAAPTGFLLAMVGGDKEYSDFTDPTATIRDTTSRDMERLIKELPENPKHSLIPGKQLLGRASGHVPNRLYRRRPLPRPPE